MSLRKWPRVVLPVSLWLVLLPAVAAADVVPAPPSDCPDGSTARTSHAGGYCAPSTCSSDSDCEEGESCAEHPLCVEQRTGYSRGGEFQVNHAVASCAGGASCPSGSSCETAKRCVSPGASGGGGCSTQGPGAVTTAAVVLSAVAIVAAVALLRKRRRARARS